MTEESKLNSIAILETIIDQTVHGLIVLNSKLQVQYWNQWMVNKSGIAADDAINKPLDKIFNNANLTRIKNALNNAITKGHSAALSQSFSDFKLGLFSNAQKTLDIIPQISISPLKNTEGLCLLQITDVTASVTRERLLKSIANEAHLGKEAAENLSQLKSSFVATVSHELRTPLTSMIGSLGLLKGNVVGKLNAAQESLLNVAYKNSDLLLSLINSILDLEKIESGTIEFNFKNISLYELLEQATTGITGYGEKINISFTLTLPEEDILVYADADKLLQVLNNLLSNAAKFSHPGQTVNMHATTEKHFVRISVADKGQGIPDSFKSSIYDKFTQLESQDNRNANGTGLGLAIAKLIIDKHNGKIDFDSTVGEGTTFYINIPIASKLSAKKRAAKTSSAIVQKKLAG